MKRLARSHSPYLLQHKDSPVQWQPSDDIALETEKQQGKPIFLSVGCAACHWCHVMEHEGFEDAAIAALLNEKFICVKVDREERSDSVPTRHYHGLCIHRGQPSRCCR